MRARICPLLTTLGVVAALVAVSPGPLGPRLVGSARAAEAAPAGGKTAGSGSASSSVSTGVLVRCATEKADIFIDGDQVGQTPLGEALALKAGEHTIRVARLGFTPYIDVFKVKAGQVTKIDVEIIPISGVLRVLAPKEEAAADPASPKASPSTAPAGPGKGMLIRIFIDDKYQGQPPLETELAIGTHSVRIERGGYFPDRFSLNAVAGETVEHVADLKPLPPDQNPYAKKEPPPTKWYQKWWVWTLGAVGVAVIATAVIVPIVVTQQNSLCNNVDVCATASGSALTVPAATPAPGAALTLRF